jgi:chromosomal replication initiation ATPase DnaA
VTPAARAELTETFLHADDAHGLRVAIRVAFEAGVAWALEHVADLRMVERVAAELETTVEALRREYTGNHPYAKPRQLAMWLLRERHGLTYQAIGRALGCDHSTAIYGVRRVEADAGMLERARAVLAKLREQSNERMEAA